VAGLAGPYALFFVPKGSGGGAGGQAAKDALGNDVKTNAWLATHQKGDRSLTQGLKVRRICFLQDRWIVCL
jgi:cytochrome b6-f complex iron-sulfur subunit